MLSEAKHLMINDETLRSAHTIPASLREGDTLLLGQPLFES